MLLFLFLLLSFLQVGFLGIGGNASAQALLEHEVITLHHWLTPGQMADLMAFCRILPGGTGINTATLASTLAASSQFGFWGTLSASIVSLVGLAVPSTIGRHSTPHYKKKNNINAFLTALWWCFDR